MKEKVAAHLIFLTGVCLCLAGGVFLLPLIYYLVLINTRLLVVSVLGIILFCIGSIIGDLGADKLDSIYNFNSQCKEKIN